VPSGNCNFGVEEQTADHIPASCPLYHPPSGTLGLAAFDDDAVNWLKNNSTRHLMINIGPSEEESSSQ